MHSCPRHPYIERATALSDTHPQTCIDMVQRNTMELDHKSNYRVCCIKWLLQGFPHSICTVLSSGYYRVFFTVFVLSYQVGFPHSICTVLSSGYYRYFLSSGYGN